MRFRIHARKRVTCSTRGRMMLVTFAVVSPPLLMGCFIPNAHHATTVRVIKSQYYLSRSQIRHVIIDYEIQTRNIDYSNILFIS